MNLPRSRLTLPHNAHIAFALPPLVPRSGNTPQYSHYSAIFAFARRFSRAIVRTGAARPVSGFADGPQLNCMLSTRLCEPCVGTRTDVGTLHLGRRSVDRLSSW